MNAIELKPGIFWVGARDWNRRLFDALIPLPMGTTYNSYLVKGEQKTALVDTVNPGFEQKLLDNLERAGAGRIDYLVMNHAEPDHAGSIPAVMEKHSQAVLVATKKGADMAGMFYNVPDNRIKRVSDGDSLDLGGKTLRFIEAPFLHWPETMFTYLEEQGLLFSCDFFGFHTSQAMFDYETEDLMPLAQSYYGEIMMPFSKMGKKAMEKIAGLEIRMIAPSHGPVHTSPERIIAAYKSWTAGETANKAIVVYVSMWQSTEKMVSAAVDSLLSEGIEVCIHNLAVADLGHIARDLVDSRAVVFGAPTVLGGLHPAGLNGLHLVKALRPPLKYGLFLSSFGWSGGAQKQALEILDKSAIEFLGAFEIKGPPSSHDLDSISAAAQELARKIKQAG